MTDFTIRDATAEHIDRIKEIAVAANMFGVDEVDFFDEMFHGALDGSLENHRWLVAETEAGDVLGAAQYAPEPFADRMWNVYFIAVDPGQQGNGIGGAIMSHVENDLRRRGDASARTLIVETSSTEQYATTRTFYEGLGYDREARIRQFYGPDDDKIVFWKAIG